MTLLGLCRLEFQFPLSIHPEWSTTMKALRIVPVTETHFAFIASTHPSFLPVLWAIQKKKKNNFRQRVLGILESISYVHLIATTWNTFPRRHTTHVVGRATVIFVAIKVSSVLQSWWHACHLECNVAVTMAIYYRSQQHFMYWWITRYNPETLRRTEGHLCPLDVVRVVTFLPTSALPAQRKLMIMNL